MAKTDLLALASPGSRALKNVKYEKYCRLRASAQPRIAAYREAGWETSDDDDAYSNACRLERRPGVRERIEYLSHQDEELVAEKRRRIEETLWSMHEADIGEFFETYEIAKTDKNGNIETNANGNMLTIEEERPRKLSNIPAEIRRNIEKVTIDGKGRVVPQLYSKLAASQELRKMLNIGRADDRSDVSRLSDAELVQQLSDQAKQLRVDINLNYSFAQPPTPDKDEQG
jgi:terminase small subunit-like protein